jgi:hypothetical protein
MRHFERFRRRPQIEQRWLNGNKFGSSEENVAKID